MLLVSYITHWHTPLDGARLFHIKLAICPNPIYKSRTKQMTAISFSLLRSFQFPMIIIQTKKTKNHHNPPRCRDSSCSINQTFSNLPTSKKHRTTGPGPNTLPLPPKLHQPDIEKARVHSTLPTPIFLPEATALFTLTSSRKHFPTKAHYLAIGTYQPLPLAPMRPHREKRTKEPQKNGFHEFLPVFARRLCRRGGKTRRTRLLCTVYTQGPTMSASYE